MKKYVFLIVTAITFCTRGNAQNLPSYLPLNGLVAWYPFNGNTNDESGNGRNATNNGATLTVDRFNSNNKSYYFNGTNAGITATNFPTSYSSYTISGWFKTDTTYYEDCNIFTQSGSWTESSSFGISAAGNNYNARHRKSDYVLIGAANLPLEKNWVHVATTWDGAMIRVYKNGNLEDSVPCSTKSNFIANFRIGNGIAGGGIGYYFRGKIDDLGIWNRALSQMEIVRLYNSCSGFNHTVTLIPSGSTNLCNGDSLKLSSNLVGLYTYNWFRNDVKIIGANTNSLYVKESGAYKLELDSSGCNAISSSVNVVVNSLPNVQCVVTPFVNIMDTNVSIIGTPQGGIFTGIGVSNNKFSPLSAGFGSKKIKYTYTDNNGCKNFAEATLIVYDTVVCSISVTDTLIINTKTTGTNESYNVNRIKVYPNPANTHITIDYGEYLEMDGYSIKITNTQGQLVFTTNINKQTSIIDLSTWTGKGIYFIQLLDKQNNSIDVRKILIQ